MALGMNSLPWPLRACVKATLLLWLVRSEKHKSTGASRNTTACQECALLRMVHEGDSKSAHALTERMRNLYGVYVGRKTINHRLMTRGYRVSRKLRNPSMTANNPRLCRNCRWHGDGRTWLWLLGPLSSWEVSHVFRCTLSMATWEFIDCRENASTKTSRLPASRLEEILSMSGDEGWVGCRCVGGVCVGGGCVWVGGGWGLGCGWGGGRGGHIVRYLGTIC